MSVDNVGLVAALVVAGSGLFLPSCIGFIRFLKRARQWEAPRNQVLALGWAVFLVSALLSIVMYGTALFLYLKR